MERPPAVSGDGGEPCRGDTLPSLSLVVDDGGVGGRGKPRIRFILVLVSIFKLFWH
jgi:hypothetical protein